MGAAGLLAACLLVMPAQGQPVTVETVAFHQATHSDTYGAEGGSVANGGRDLSAPWSFTITITPDGQPPMSRGGPPSVVLIFVDELAALRTRVTRPEVARLC